MFDSIFFLIENNKMLTLNEMAAQAWVFYVAGFETSSTTMSFCLYELAKNPDIQKKVQSEIDEIMGKYNGKLSYDAVHEMKYLEWCIDGNKLVLNYRHVFDSIS